MALDEAAPDGKPMLTVSDADDLDAWLVEHHERTTGVWLVRARPGSDHPRVDYEDMIAVLLCYGWVDASVKVLDARRSLLWISPRRTGSVWSKPNKERVVRLEAAGRMRPAGAAAIQRAKDDGSWTTMDGPDNLEVPDDLAAAFDDQPQARANFDAFPPSARKGYLTQIALAKTEATRARRIAQTVQRSAAGLRP